MFMTSRVLVGVFLLLVIGRASAQTKQVFACPASITEAGVEHKFERVSIYNGKQGGQEYELAPDDEKNGPAGKITQIWNVRDYRSMNVFVRCRYAGSATVRSMDVPAAFTSCAFDFQLDRKQKFI